jgi:Ca2+-transporting ATPase
VVVMRVILCGMEYGNWFRDGPMNELTPRQVSIFFTVYVFFQVWNQINARSLTPDMSGFDGLLRNRTFLAIAGTIAVVQALIISVPFLGAIFNVEPLGLLDWLCILAGTASVLLFGEALRRVRLAAYATPVASAASTASAPTNGA